MHAGIPGIGLGGLFFVLSTFVMLAVEIVRTVQGRSSLARWRLVGRQSAIASAIVLVTTLMLWLLDFLFFPSETTGVNGGSGSGDGGSRALEAAATVPVAATPILGTLALLVVVLILAETARLYVSRPRPPVK